MATCCPRGGPPSPWAEDSLVGLAPCNTHRWGPSAFNRRRIVIARLWWGHVDRFVTLSKEWNNKEQGNQYDHDCCGHGSPTEGNSQNSITLGTHPLRATDWRVVRFSTCGYLMLTIRTRSHGTSN